MYQYVNERSMTVMILAHKMAAWGNTAAMVTEPAVKAYIRKKGLCNLVIRNRTASMVIPGVCSYDLRGMP